MTSEDVAYAMRLFARERVRRPEPILVSTYRDATDRVMHVELSRRVRINPHTTHHDRQVHTQFALSENSLALLDHSTTADVLLLNFDAALEDIEASEVLERIEHDGIRVRIRTADDEARVERAALKLMEIVEEARKKRGPR